MANVNWNSERVSPSLGVSIISTDFPCPQLLADSPERNAKREQIAEQKQLPLGI
jgi:hypothetical protein